MGTYTVFKAACLSQNTAAKETLTCWRIDLRAFLMDKRFSSSEIPWEWAQLNSWLVCRSFVEYCWWTGMFGMPALTDQEEIKEKSFEKASKISKELLCAWSYKTVVFEFPSNGMHNSPYRKVNHLVIFSTVETWNLKMEQTGKDVSAICILHWHFVKLALSHFYCTLYSILRLGPKKTPPAETSKGSPYINPWTQPAL